MCFIVYIKTDDIYKDMQKMSKKGLTVHIISWKVYHQKERTKRYWFIEGQIWGVNNN